MNRKLKPQPVKRAPQRFVRRGPLAKVRRAGLIILQASIGVWSPSTERYIRISDIWESQTMKSGIDYLTGEHWFAPPPSTERPTRISGIWDPPRTMKGGKAK